MYKVIVILTVVQHLGTGLKQTLSQPYRTSIWNEIFQTSGNVHLLRSQKKRPHTTGTAYYTWKDTWRTGCSISKELMNFQTAPEIYQKDLGSNKS